MSATFIEFLINEDAVASDGNVDRLASVIRTAIKKGEVALKNKDAKGFDSLAAKQAIEIIVDVVTSGIKDSGSGDSDEGKGKIDVHGIVTDANNSLRTQYNSGDESSIIRFFRPVVSEVGKILSKLDDTEKGNVGGMVHKGYQKALKSSEEKRENIKYDRNKNVIDQGRKGDEGTRSTRRAASKRRDRVVRNKR